MSEKVETPRGYEPADVEKRWYRHWLERGHFHAQDTSERPPFCIVIPPPNVTGSLHMGHALVLTLQDTLVRWKRMSGFNALWLPGTDHAGIATQMLVERELKKTEGKSRHDVGRAAFLERVWAWKERHGGRIREQTEVMGASLDWDRERFTMDEGLSRAVREVFVRLHEEGLIYRAEKLINWCPQDQTALSDLEVDHEEGQKGELWSFAYPLEGGSGEIVVATTRPETMLGDTAVAVHPEDPRYVALIGRTVRHPISGREIPIVGDAILVDPAFGTGAVKVTPAHDFNDFEVGKRHGLPMISIFDEAGRVNAQGGAFAGMDRFEARAAVKEKLAQLGLDRGTKEHVLALGHCQRCRAVVEPRLSYQWFVKIEPLARPAIEAVEQGRTVFIPEQWTNTYNAWMREIHDWCISRQLWWGHQIPAWYCEEDHVTVARETPAACGTCGRAGLRQDADVLDTWFSSALWPFSTLGWPDRTPALATFYPTSVMETGFDIIFFWVARMMMMGLHFMGDVPFRTVFLHAMVRDEKGEKMSKTKGNVIDPLDVTAKYGADALRFTLASMTAQGRDIKLSLDRVAGYRAFANKIWNAARFALPHVEKIDPSRELDLSQVSDADRWILMRFHRAAADVIAALEAFRFNEACARVYSFTWHELCDWYIELAKPRLYEGTDAEKAASGRVLRDVLDGALRLLHPFMPFVTEEIWQKLPRLPGDPDSIMVAAYPAPDPDRIQDGEAARFDLLVEIVKALRSLRVDLGVPDGSPITVWFDGPKATADWLEARGGWLSRLARVERLERRGPGRPFPGGAPATVVSGVELRLPIAGVVNREELLAKLTKDEERLSAELARVRGRLGNAGFMAKAPPEVIEKDRQLESELSEKLQKVKDNQMRLEGENEERVPETDGTPAEGTPPEDGKHRFLEAVHAGIARMVGDEKLRRKIDEGVDRLGAGDVDGALSAFENAARMRGLIGDDARAAIDRARERATQVVQRVAARVRGARGKPARKAAAKAPARKAAGKTAPKKAAGKAAGKSARKAAGESARASGGKSARKKPRRT